MILRRTTAAASVIAGLAVLAPACGSAASDAESKRSADAGLGAIPGASKLDVSSLTDRQLAGQRVIATFRDTRVPGPELRRLVRRGELAGVILFAREAPTIAAARKLADQLQAEARRSPIPLPLLVMIDQEGGDGRTTGARRLSDAPPRRSAAQMGAAGTATARASGREAGRALLRAGVNVNLAPVADVGRAGAALTREGRTFGRSTRAVGQLTAAFVGGQRAAGIASTLKHFPGFGAARVNTDDAPARITSSRTTLRRVDEAAFIPGLKAGAKLVMLSNAVYPALDTLPASLSRRIAGTELRSRLKFAGVSITDDLEATGLDRYGSPATRALRSARAGVDLVLLGRRATSGIAAQKALTAAVGDGRIPRAQAEAAARRVLALRAALRRR